MSNYLTVQRVAVLEMARRAPPVGIDHATVVPANLHDGANDGSADESHLRDDDRSRSRPRPTVD